MKKLFFLSRKDLTQQGAPQPTRGLWLGNEMNDNMARFPSIAIITRKKFSPFHHTVSPQSYILVAVVAVLAIYDISVPGWSCLWRYQPDCVEGSLVISNHSYLFGLCRKEWGFYFSFSGICGMEVGRC